MEMHDGICLLSRIIEKSQLQMEIRMILGRQLTQFGTDVLNTKIVGGSVERVQP